MTLRIFTTGGTFDKIYFDALSEFRFGEPIVAELLDEANVGFDYAIEPLLQKDSLDMNNADRDLIRAAVARVPEARILIIHGTDSMVETAMSLLDLPDKTIVLFGAMQPARMRDTDARFNLGFASAAVQLLPVGVYLAMNGRIFDPCEVRKNRARNRFEPIEDGAAPDPSERDRG